MASTDVVTRETLKRKLIVNAATKPLNVAAPAVVLIVGMILGVTLIAAPVAVVAYVALAWQTFMNIAEAEKVSEEAYRAARGPARTLDVQTLAPEIAGPVNEARRTAQAIRQTIDEAEHGFEDVSADVDALVAAMDTSARRAQLIHKTLADQHAAGQDADRLAHRIETLRPQASDRDIAALITDLTAQRDATVRLQDKLDRFTVGMQRICVALGLLRTRMVEMSASEEEAAQRMLAAQARELRERTDLLAESMAEVFADGDGL